MKRIKYISLTFLFSALLFLNACEPDEQGFISDLITYSQNPFNVTQGSVALSNAIVSDGSTLPLRVKLLEIRNKQTGEVATELMKEFNTTVYTSQITQRDTTFELVQSKIEKRSWPVFKINEEGGQLQFSPETVNVPVGEYTFDVEVSNDSGSKVFKDICTIRILTGNPVPNIAAQVVTYATKKDEEGNTKTVIDYPGFSVSSTRAESSENTIMFKFVDKDDEAIDPIKFGFRELIREQANDYKFSDATPWLGGKPKSVTSEGVTYTFPLGPFPYNWISGGKAFRFAYIPSGSAATEFLDKNGVNAFDVKIYTDSFKIKREGAYVFTVKCLTIDI
ncbi:DUF5007 domain-containing protein [Pseudochryseolinea flava]|nr:DUF5007 domain-containing protein [Pseudochryseolinea flava]